MRSLSILSLLLASVISMGQVPPTGVASRTAAPARDGAYSVPSSKGAVPQARVAKGGAYELDPDDDDDDISADDDSDTAPIPDARRAGFGLSGQGIQDSSQVGQELLKSPNAAQARAAEARRLSAAAQSAQPGGVDQIQTSLAQQKKEIQSILKQMNRQNEAQTGVGRDAMRTDAVADVEFAEAMASRRASSIARARGLALIPAMSTIEMRLLTYASSEQGGKFKALIITDVWDASFASIGIPAGTLARGYIESASNDADSRIHMTITEFVLPSGDSVQLRIPDAVTDPIGATGPKANVNHNWGTRIGGTALYVAAGTLSAVGSKSTGNATAGFTDVLQQNLAGQMGQQAQSSFQSGMQIKPVVELREGSVMSMILGSNLYLVPWERFRPVIPAPNQTSAH